MLQEKIENLQRAINAIDNAKSIGEVMDQMAPGMSAKLQILSISRAIDLTEEISKGLRQRAHAALGVAYSDDPEEQVRLLMQGMARLEGEDPHDTANGFMKQVSEDDDLPPAFKEFVSKALSSDGTDDADSRTD